ncbi:MAG: hypothetical protein AAF696_33270 [Bacteroidota bacterium]
MDRGLWTWMKVGKRTNHPNSMKAFVYLLIISFFLLSACANDDILEAETYVYNINQCDDRWGNANQADELEDRVSTYLEDVKIEMLGFRVLVIEGVFCQACGCPSGLSIVIDLSQRDGRRLLNLNDGWEKL